MEKIVFGLTLVRSHRIFPFMDNGALPQGMPATLAAVGDLLAHIDAFWSHWGFEPWAHSDLRGVCRLQRFVKDGLLGPVAEYRAWDCIVWQAGSAADREALWRNAAPMPEIMTQRYLFLLEDTWPGRRIRSFALGFRGYVEFYGVNPLMPPGKGKEAIRDLTGLIPLGVRFATTGSLPEEGRTDGT